MSVFDLCSIINGDIVNLDKEYFDNIQTDTRLVNSNSLLFVFNLSHDNAYKYIKSMKIKPAIIVINDYEDTIYDVSCIKVKDTIKSYGMIAGYYKSLKHRPTIMITGSVGKTTTKDMIYDILSINYKCKKTEESQNNILGVSKMFLEIKDEDILIVEAGSNHMGEIKELGDIIRPDIGVITRIGTSHIGNFKSILNIYKEKTSFINDDITVLVNGCDKYLNKLCGNNIYKVGKKNLKVKKIKYDNGISFVTNNVCLSLNTLNKDMIMNATLAFYTGLLFNIPVNKMRDVLGKYVFPKHRQNVYYIGNSILIDDSYNASYESVLSSINMVKKIRKKKIFILGDMFELGDKSSFYHNKILKKLRWNRVYTVGNYYNNKYNFKNKDALYDFLKGIDLSDKVILVKASRKMEFDKVVDFIKKELENSR